MALNQVIGGDFKGSPVKESSINDKNYKVISIFPSMKYGVGEIDLSQGEDGVIRYEVLNQESSNDTGNAILGAALFGIVGAIVGSGSKTAYIVAVEYYYGEDLMKSLIEIDSRLYKIFIASQF